MLTNVMLTNKKHVVMRSNLPDFSSQCPHTSAF